MYYFAYGGNTNPYHINKEYPTIKFIGRAVLKDYRLVFRKTDLRVTLEDSYCDIEYLPRTSTHGVVYDVEEEDLKKFDLQEIEGILYDRIEVDVVDEFKNKLKCYTYVMTEKFNEYKMPTSRYYSLVLTGYKHYKLPFMQMLIALELCPK